MNVLVRPAGAADAQAAGDILWGFQRDMAWMPNLYARDECVDFCNRMIAKGWVSIAEEADCVCGFLARDREEICSIYVAPGYYRRGVGNALIEAAKAGQPSLWLKCFEANLRARGFYTKQGFVEVARSDGRANDENLPDITFVWQMEAAG